MIKFAVIIDCVAGLEWSCFIVLSSAKPLNCTQQKTIDSDEGDMHQGMSPTQQEMICYNMYNMYLLKG